jgi:CCR4-NOT transcription complex subunit 1
MLDRDHNKNKSTFNQKPYYRLIMDLLTAINLSNCFNPQTQQLILLSMADLLIKLSPSKFPAFSFSWIELISHK